LLPARPLQGYQDLKTAFEGPLPEEGQEGDAVLAELIAKAEQGLMMATGPRFFGWVIG
jgi:hypothetical protein